MTNSPPAKVKTTESEPDGALRVLAAGVDSLVVAMQVCWPDEGFLGRLAELRRKAEAGGDAVPCEMRPAEGEGTWVFNLQPHGCRGGYSYLLNGRDMSMKMGGWTTPQQRPSVMLEFRSEFLWGFGPQQAVWAAVELIEGAGGHVQSVKASRADLCVDMLLPEELWTTSLADQFVTRASGIATYTAHRRLSGFTIGKGELVARLYDKPMEIVAKSHKDWMYDVWRMKEVPDGHRVIRIEFQVRRAAMKELGIDTIDDLFERRENLWAYCSRQWLKVQDGPGKHHTQRNTLSWWEAVQDGFPGAQRAKPLIRSKAISLDRERLTRQLYGNWTSLIALDSQHRNLDDDTVIVLDQQIVDLLDHGARIGLNDAELTKRVESRLAKFQRGCVEHAEALHTRRRLGLCYEGPSHYRSMP